MTVLDRIREIEATLYALAEIHDAARRFLASEREWLAGATGARHMFLRDPEPDQRGRFRAWCGRRRPGPLADKPGVYRCADCRQRAGLPRDGRLIEL